MIKIDIKKALEIMVLSDWRGYDNWFSKQAKETILKELGYEYTYKVELRDVGKVEDNELLKLLVKYQHDSDYYSLG